MRYQISSNQRVSASKDHGIDKFEMPPEMIRNQQFGGSVLELVYVVSELGSVSGIWMLQRSVVEKCEAWDDGLGDFDAKFVQVVQP